MPLDDASIPIPGPNEAFVDRNRYITGKWYPWMVRLFKTLKTTINALDTVQETVDQVNGTWTLSINDNNRVTGFIKLDGSAVSTKFSVLADKFEIVHPSANGTTITAFVAGLVNGVASVGLNGNLNVDGSILGRSIAAEAITAEKIAADAITADKIAADAITADKIAAAEITADKIAINGLTGGVSQSAVANSNASTTSATFVALSGMSLSVTVGANEKILLTFTATLRGQATNPAEFTLYMDGNPLTNSPIVGYPYQQAGGGAPEVMNNPCAAMTFIVAPEAGGHTFQVRWRSVFGSLGRETSNNYRSFSLMRFIR